MKKKIGSHWVDLELVVAISRSKTFATLIFQGYELKIFMTDQEFYFLEVEWLKLRSKEGN